MPRDLVADGGGTAVRAQETHAETQTSRMVGNEDGNVMVWSMLCEDVWMLKNKCLPYMFYMSLLDAEEFMSRGILSFCREMFRCAPSSLDHLFWWIERWLPWTPYV